MRSTVLAITMLFLVTGSGWATQQYDASGMVLKVDQPHNAFVVSCQAISGFMEAMTMPFEVRAGKELSRFTRKNPDSKVGAS